MRVIGIIGGIASGKSLATQFLQELGAAVLDGDRAGHCVLRRADVIAEVERRWGAGVLDDQRQIRRDALAEIVFGPAETAAAELKFLEDLTHPHIRAKLTHEAECLAAEGSARAVVLDAPVLLKAGWDDFCDILLFVDAPQSDRLARARTRGWTEQQFADREAAQVSIDKKRARADVVIDNSGSPEQLREQIRRFWDSLFGYHVRQ